MSMEFPRLSKRSREFQRNLNRSAMKRNTEIKFLTAERNIAGKENNRLRNDQQREIISSRLFDRSASSVLLFRLTEKSPSRIFAESLLRLSSDFQETIFLFVVLVRLIIEFP